MTAIEELDACEQAVKKAHHIRWYARVEPSAEYPDGYIPRTRFMAGKDWGWDVKCSCGWWSLTGGAVQARVREAVTDHYTNVAFNTLYADPTWASRFNDEMKR